MHPVVGEIRDTRIGRGGRRRVGGRARITRGIRTEEGSAVTLPTVPEIRDAGVHTHIIDNHAAERIPEAGTIPQTDKQVHPDLHILGGAAILRIVQLATVGDGSR